MTAMTLPAQWAPVVCKPMTKELVHRLPDGTYVPLHDPAALLPYPLPTKEGA
jgi:hypothetical protein